MKNLIILLVTITSLIACEESSKSNSVGESPEVKQTKPIKLERKDPVPKTITLQEVSRIAIIEAEQFITNAKKDGFDYSSVTEIKNQAQQAYDSGEYKKAQLLAVEVRQKIEDIMSKK